MMIHTANLIVLLVGSNARAEAEAALVQEGGQDG